MTLRVSHLFVLLACTACYPSLVTIRKAPVPHPVHQAASRHASRMGYQKSGPHIPWKPFE